MADLPPLEFKSPEELSAILENLGGRLHYINRVTGESNYFWHMAELLRDMGKLAEHLTGSVEVERAFGSGYEQGTLGDKEQRERILEMLRDVRKGR